MQTPPDIPQRWEQARSRLVPSLRRVTEPAGAWLAARADPANTLLRRPFVPHVHELVALDLEDVRLFVNQGHLGRWGVSAEAVWTVARANLAGVAAPGLRLREELGLWHLDAGDGYEASRLLLPGWLAAFADRVPGRPVAIAPSPRVLLVGGDGDDDQLARLLALADTAFSRADSPLTPVPVTVDAQGAVHPLALPDDSPLADRLLAASRVLAARVYAEQAAELRDAASLRAVVADVELVHEGLGGAAWTVCRWREADRPTLLPVTDCVTLEDGESEVMVAWETLEQHAAGCLSPTELDPPRVRARWPGRATLAALRREGD